MVLFSTVRITRDSHQGKLSLYTLAVTSPFPVPTEISSLPYYSPTYTNMIRIGPSWTNQAQRVSQGLPSCPRPEVRDTRQLSSLNTPSYAAACYRSLAAYSPSVTGCLELRDA
jgi:hypothetical protein